MPNESDESTAESRRTVPLTVKRGEAFEVHCGDQVITIHLGGDRRTRIAVRVDLPAAAYVHRLKPSETDAT